MQRRRRSVRPIAAGILLPIVALLLTTLLLNGGDETGQPFPSDSTQGAGQSYAAPGPASGDDGLALPASIATQTTGIQADDPDEAAAARAFTVAIAPLDFDANERSGSVAFPLFHSFLLDELRAIRNLELIELPAATDELTPDDADFYLETRGERDVVWTFSVKWSATRGGASASISKGQDTLEGEVIQAFTRDWVNELRRYPFPPADSRAVELQSVALDSERPNEERFEALLELHDIPRRFEFVGRSEQRMVAVAGAAIVAGSPDPEIRGRAWQAMADVEDFYLIGPLVDSLLFDPSDFVRVEATKLLAREYSEDPRAESTLQTAMASDRSPQVRAHARWESLDAEGRRAYLAATLGNPDLTDAERFELIASDVSDIRDYFDRQPMLALVDIAGRARASSAGADTAEDSGAVPAAQVVPLLIDYLKVRQNNQRIRASVASALTRHIDEPGVREAFRELSNDYSLNSSVRREIAAALRDSLGPAP